jgi:hypothetical protein
MRISGNALFLYCIAPLGAFALCNTPLSAQTTKPPAKPAAKPSPLVGIWQASPVMGSGWAETYRFFPDGRVIHHTNQMDGESRLRAEQGTYQAAGSTLTLTLTAQTLWIGGKRVPATGSTGTKYELDGVTEQRAVLRKPETRRLPLGKIAKLGNPPRLSVTLGKTRFYKFDDDPKRYP